MPAIGSMDAPCNWVIVTLPGAGDGGCGCDPNNTAFFNEAAPSVSGYKTGPSQADPCKCKLSAKSGSAPNLAGPPPSADPHAGRCCYKVKCNGGAEMDISNLDAQQLYQYQQACCRGGKKKKECDQEPCPKGWSVDPKCFSGCTGKCMQKWEALLYLGAALMIALCAVVVSRAAPVILWTLLGPALALAFTLLLWEYQVQLLAICSGVGVASAVALTYFLCLKACNKCCCRPAAGPLIGLPC
jgi:hypothetical protein